MDHNEDRGGWDDARLYVNGAAQPCLIVKDLKHGDRAGRIALWAHVETDAYFGPIAVTAR